MIPESARQSLYGLLPPWQGALVIDDYHAWKHWVEERLVPIVENAIEAYVDGVVVCNHEALVRCPECDEEIWL